jgi:FkbM family methyltransferase
MRWLRDDKSHKDLTVISCLDRIAVGLEESKHDVRRIREDIESISQSISTPKADPKGYASTPQVSSPSSSFPIPQFWEPNYWEPSVQLPLRDYCRPGDVVFDVGANAGALSMVMSRHVGPRGIVCAFEASPRIVDKTLFNLVNAGCSNVSLYHRAVFHTSNEIVRLFPGTHLNDSIYNDHGAEGGISFEVETLALDDFVSATGLMPSLMKMDIEGAEFDALKGCTNILQKGKPRLILEQSPSDMRCHQLLTSIGYIAVDLANYRRVQSTADFEAGVGISNILFIHRDQVADDPYANAGTPEICTELPTSDFILTPGKDIALRSPIELSAGRYVCRAHFISDIADNEIFAGIDSNRGRLLRYHTYSKLLAESYREWVFSLNAPAKITPYIQFIRGSNRDLQWDGATIYKFESFNNVPHPVVY